MKFAFGISSHEIANIRENNPRVCWVLPWVRFGGGINLWCDEHANKSKNGGVSGQNCSQIFVDNFF